MSEAPIGLEALDARLRHDLEILQYPPPDWVVPRYTASGDRVVDVVVIGAGMCGLAAGFALMPPALPISASLMLARPGGKVHG